MKRTLLLLVSLALLLLIVGCGAKTIRPDVDPDLAEKEAAIQKRMAVEEQVKHLRRLSNVSQPILTNGTPLCGDEVTYYIGMDTNSLDAVSDEWKTPYKEVLGLEDRVKVTYVLKESPAELAGVKAGDVILMVNGEKVEPGKNCYEKFLENLQSELEQGNKIVLWVERAGTPKMLMITLVQRCSYPVILTDDAIVNAFADGSKVMITKGMMNFAEKDDDLALVVGHELGHNVMDHIDKTAGSRVFGAVLDGLLGGLTGVYTSTFQNAAGMMYSQEYEQEADYVGMYFMERGGYNSSNAAMFWRKMGANFPYSIGHATTHPTSASRYVFLDKCAVEIKQKRESGKELLPDYK